MQRVDHKMTKVINTSNTQQLAYKMALNNFTFCTKLKVYIDELTFLKK